MSGTGERRRMSFLLSRLSRFFMVFCSTLLVSSCGSSNDSNFQGSQASNRSLTGFSSEALSGGAKSPNPGPGSGTPVTFTPGGDGPDPGPAPGPGPDPGSSAASFLYLANPTPNGGGGWITTLGVATDGLLSVIEGRKDNTGRPLGIFRSPDGQFVYAVNVSGDDITPYTVGQGTGLLTTNGANIPAGDSPRGLSFTPNQSFAYTSNFNGDVIGYSVLANGRLDPLTGFPVASGVSFSSPVVGPDGTHLYTPDSGIDEIGIYDISGTGALTRTHGVPAGDRPFGIAFPVGVPFAYATNANDDTLSAYSVVNGDLIPLTPPTYPTGSTPYTVKAHPTLPVIYSLGSADQTINVFSVDSGTGALTEIDSELTGPGPGSVIIDPTGRFMFIPRDDYDMSTYQIAADGTLTRTADFDDPSIDSGFARGGVTIDNTLNRRVKEPRPEND